jgi:26S proteasome regulatory subunit N3
MTLYRTSCLHRDEMGEAVLLNLILRNFLHYNLIQSAHIFTSKITFPENASNNQFCRYLYSMGRIQAVQLEYSDAFLRLSMALRKAPQDIAIGFNITVQKLLIIVQLLMGDIPERAIFNSSNPAYRVALKPYFYLTQAVRAGNLHQFNDVLKDHQDIFSHDKNLTLINRLGHNVLKIGLRKISVSYSRISLQDVAEKLQLSSATAAEYVCARAIK